MFTTVKFCKLNYIFQDHSCHIPASLVISVGSIFLESLKCCLHHSVKYLFGTLIKFVLAFAKPNSNTFITAGSGVDLHC
jgi:hypothetical protein